MAFLHSFIDRLMKSITHFFSPRQADPDPAIEEFTFDREPFETPQANIKRKQKRDRKGGALTRKSLADLLDNLDRTFKIMKLPRDSCSWLPKKDIAGLKRLGVYVPDNWIKQLGEMHDVVADVTRPFPAIMAISFTWDHEHKRDGGTLPNTMFAIKVQSLPHFAARIPGVAYTFGYSYNFNNKNFWARCYMVVDPKTGKITPCDELFTETHTIPVRRRKKQDGPTQFVTRQWKEAELLIADQFGTVEERKRAARQSFNAMLDWWRDRHKRWSVGVRKGGDRVTFSVDPENTKTYFADRDKSIKTASGRAQKIIHYVRAHERIRDGKTVAVREHIRGIREFDWGGHHCVVTAPKFHNATMASEYELPALGDDDLDKYKGKLADLRKVGAMLADMEEMDLRKRA